MPSALKVRVGWGTWAVVACVALAGCTRSDEVQGEGLGTVDASSKRRATTEAPDPVPAVTSAEVVDPPGGVPWIPLDPPPLPFFSIVGMSGDRLVVVERVPNPTFARGEYTVWTVPRAAVHDPATGWQVFDGCEIVGGCDRLHEVVAVSASTSSMTLVLRRSPATPADLADPAQPIVDDSGGELVVARLDLDSGAWERLGEQQVMRGAPVRVRGEGVRSDDATIVLEQALASGQVAIWEISGGALRAGPEGAESSIDPSAWELVSGTTTFRFTQPSMGTPDPQQGSSTDPATIEWVGPGGESVSVALPESDSGQITPSGSFVADGAGGLMGTVEIAVEPRDVVLWHLAPGATEWRSARAPGWPAALTYTAVVVQSDSGLFQHPLPFEDAPDMAGEVVEDP